MSHPTPPPNDGNDYQPTSQQPAQPGQYAQPTPQYGAPYTPAAPGNDRAFGTTSIVFTLLGAIAAVVGLFAVRWTKLTGGDGGTGLVGTEPKFLDLRRIFLLIDKTDIAQKPDWTIAYFNYAGFVILGVTVVLAIVAALPTPATSVFRILGFIVGIVSAAAALFVIVLDDVKDNGLSEYLKGGLGLYLVAGGSLLMAIGALIGSRRRA